MLRRRRLSCLTVDANYDFRSWDSVGVCGGQTNAHTHMTHMHAYAYVVMMVIMNGDDGDGVSSDSDGS